MNLEIIACMDPMKIYKMLPTSKTIRRQFGKKLHKYLDGKSKEVIKKIKFENFLNQEIIQLLAEAEKERSEKILEEQIKRYQVEQNTPLTEVQQIFIEVRFFRVNFFLFE